MTGLNTNIANFSFYRHPFLGKYKAGFTKDGIIKALDVDLYSNAGYTLDLSFSVVQRAMFHVDNCYYIENINTRGYCCKTNIQSNTAFRGFGGPQGMFVTEHCVEEVVTQRSSNTWMNFKAIL